MISMLLLALIIITVSGLIAYVGDLVGRKMGRKRLSLFGLRPRHTAIVISVGVGMVIAALTIGVTLAVSKPIRDAFITPLDALRAQLHRQEHEVERTEKELQTTRAKGAEVEGKLRAQMAELDQALQQRNAIERQYSRLKKDLAAVQQQKAAADRELQRAQAQRQQVSAELEDKRKRLSATTRQLEDATHTLVETTRKLLASQNEMTALQQQLADFGRFALAPISFMAGQEILSGVLPTDGSEADRRSELWQFFAVADRVVRKESPELPKDTDALVFVRMEDGKPRQIALGDAVAMLSARIAAVRGCDQAIVRLAPVNNVPVNGRAWIVVDLVQLIPDEAVFNRGETIAEVQMTIGPKTRGGEILEQLVETLLRAKVPDALRAKKMVMITRRFDPDRPDNVPDASMSLVPWSDLLDAVDQVGGHRGKVTVAVRAQSPITRYGPLNLALKVTPVK